MPNPCRRYTHISFCLTAKTVPNHSCNHHANQLHQTVKLGLMIQFDAKIQIETDSKECKFGIPNTKAILSNTR